MPNDKYLRLEIGGRSVDVKQIREVPISISYALEDPENFEEKKASMSFDITVPATISNDKAFNTFHNPKIEDNTPGEAFKAPMSCVIDAGGIEILKGKALLKSATKSKTPQNYKVNCYGNNGDWMIDMQEITLHDVVSTTIHTFSKLTIESTWNYDGNSNVWDFVYAPVRYKQAFDAEDTVMNPLHLRPAMSIFWMLWRAFVSVGYIIESNFFNSEYFRRLVMPWTWGNFLFMDSKQLDVIKWDARSVRTPLGYWRRDDGVGTGYSVSDYPHFDPLWGFTNTSTCGGFDNANAITWNQATGLVRWTYPQQFHSQFGDLIIGITYEVSMQINVTNNSNIGVHVEWYVNGALQTTQQVHNVSAGAGGGNSFFGKKSVVYEAGPLGANDYVEAKLILTISKSYFGDYSVLIHGAICDTDCSFRATYFKKPLGGLVDFKQYEKFKEYKVLDMLRGVIDFFDISVQTDSVNKIVYMEPTYPYSPQGDLINLIEGYFKKNRLDWTTKQDIGKENELSLFADAEKEFVFSFKEDGNDGGLNKLYGRYSVIPGQSKYVFPERFKTGKKEFNNRFFSPVVHVNFMQWRDLTSNKIPTQLIAIIPENISNTSANEAEQFFQPKLAYYKGKVDKDVFGAWRWQPEPYDDPETVLTDTPLPYMFAVNYKVGGEKDPVLTYNDQAIPTNDPEVSKIAAGLMRKFYLPRLAVMRYGKYYSAWIHLNNNDVTNWLHREAIYINGDVYYLIEIDSYKPLLEESTKCGLWKYHPVTEVDIISCYPSSGSVLSSTIANSFDMKYAKLILLNTDLPT